MIEFQFVKNMMVPHAIPFKQSSITRKEAWMWPKKIDQEVRLKKCSGEKKQFHFLGERKSCVSFQENPRVYVYALDFVCLTYEASYRKRLSFHKLFAWGNWTEHQFVSQLLLPQVCHMQRTVNTTHGSEETSLFVETYSSKLIDFNMHSYWRELGIACH